ncbi:GC-rich sequence DNA-binding factor 2 isoform X1 [Latimeria chalumnae]|uniref:GC-rich sequence DNA-binding factor 2 isoform X1 n=1 Tax=Latimeria chalumnae TaxID=7897 RepID=UPI0003C1524C|nr:PREDICTED: GC-rich sequence DNA-binding factor 2 isoform X1 [Latimeria chalumnae]|eukprot:XP_006000092.1 PREDICTED: GC-rich sequence DNA-binding factor 2 isoform X1 [Latimeria chalumnae]
MFRKPNRNFRRKRAESSEEEEPSQTEAVTGQGRGEESVQLPPPLPLLFRHNQFQSRGISCSSKPAGKTRERGPEGSVEREQGDEEPGAAEGELKWSAVENKKSVLSFGDDREEEEDFKIKKPTVNTIVFKAQKKIENHSSDNGKKHLAEQEQHPKYSVRNCSEDDADDEELEGEEVPPENEDNRSSNSSSSSSSSSSDSESSTDQPRADRIPDASVIQAARRKRQLARAQGDFIPLDTSHGYNPPTQESEGDLDSDREPDDHERRIEFAPKSKTLRQRMTETIGVNESDDENLQSLEDDETVAMWEEQQIRKGVTIPQVSEMEFAGRPVVHLSKMKLESFAALPPVKLEIVQKRLSDKLQSLQEVHRAHQQEHEKFLQHMENSRNTAEALEETASAGQQLKFYKEMKLYVQNLVDCLSEKISQINELESAMHQLLQQQASAYLKRRQEVVRNESSFIQQLSYKADASENGHTDTSGKSQNVLDEYKARRAHRRQEREKSWKNEDHHEGMSSDDEMDPADHTSFQATKDSILKESQKIFEDTQDEFYSIGSILSKFDRWRQKYTDSYVDAYISLCLPKLLNPLIRLQMLDWNPLKPNCMDFEEMPWFKAVEEFRHRELGREESSDSMVLPLVIEKTVIPKIIGFVEYTWDPLSFSQTDSLTKLCKKLKEEYFFQDEPKKAMQGLINSIVTRIRETIDGDVFIPLYPKSVLEDRTSPQSQFQERQFWSAVRLLGNIFLGDGLIPEQMLQELGLDKLLNRYILLILLNSQPGEENMEKCRKVIACLPQRWFKDVKGGCMLPQLKNLAKHLFQSAQAQHGSSLDKNIRETMAEVVALLKTIGALDHAEYLIKEYNLQGLKT